MNLTIRISLVLALTVSSALAEPVTFTVKTRRGEHTATDNAVVKNGVTYVHLGALISQVGGGVSITQDRAQIDLAEKSAWLRDNNPQVSASLGIFQLAAPIVKEGNDILIALSDVKPFFEKAFRVAATQHAPAPNAPAQGPAPAPATPVPAPAVTSQPLPDLEPVALDPIEPLAPEAPAPAEAPAPLEAPAPPEAVAPPVEVASATDALTADRPVNRRVETVIIDPGHGGNDWGALGPGGLRESELTLALAHKLKQALEQSSALKTVLTRADDAEVGAAQRAILANASKGDLLVSLHTGGAFKSDARGCRLFICGKGGENAASAYADQNKSLAQQVGSSLEQETQCAFGGIYLLNCSVMKDAGMPGFMIELGMLSNPQEEALLADEQYQEKLAAAIAAGIKQYIEAATTGSAI